jgi:molybdenum cofactor cytidylyltransferase
MIAAILLAAGLSTRTKQLNKLLLHHQGKKIIKHSVDNILKSKIDYLIVITGKNKKEITNNIPNKKNIKIIFNKHYKTGMASSIKLGINNLPSNTISFFISLADMPNIQYTHYNKLIHASKKNNTIPIVPFYKSQQHNPVLFPATFINKLNKLKGDKGAKSLLNKTTIKKITFTNRALVKDFDTLEDFVN